jgi:pimeloyl-ACP methyl ester carboxylesterase
MTRRALLLATIAALLTACKGKPDMNTARTHIHFFDGLNGNRYLRALSLEVAARFFDRATVTNCAWDANAWPLIVDHNPEGIIWIGYSLGGDSAFREAKKDKIARGLILLDPVPQGFGQRWSDYHFNVGTLPAWCFARSQRWYPRSKLATKNNHVFDVGHKEFCGDSRVRSHVTALIETIIGLPHGAAQATTATPPAPAVFVSSSGVASPRAEETGSD